jgi:aminoglycoside phosphotransferase (APT) family kinase protein
MTEVIDPYTISDDSRMSFLQKALEPSLMARRLQACLDKDVHLKRIEVKRHKPERRCLIAYTCDSFTVLGKARAKGLDKRSYETQAYLYEAGLAVPQALGVIPELNMWLQKTVPGQPLTSLLHTNDAQDLIKKTATALYKLHHLSPATHRQHTTHDELSILRDRLERVIHLKPSWTDRIKTVMQACETLASTLPSYTVRGIHRDFYADQVLVHGSKIYLLDFDLYALGDPALDVGNFLGHLTELGLRLGNPKRFLKLENVFESSYLEKNSEVSSQAVQSYKTLTLARHIFISSQFEARKAFTEKVLELCEERLGLSQAATLVK